MFTSNPSVTGNVGRIIEIYNPNPWMTFGGMGSRGGMSVIFGAGRTYRLIGTRANGQPAFGVYVRDPLTGVAHANGMLVLTLAGSRISAMTRFDNSVLPLFGLPRTLPEHA